MNADQKDKVALPMYIPCICCLTCTWSTKTLTVLPYLYIQHKDPGPVTAVFVLKGPQESAKCSYERREIIEPVEFLLENSSRLCQLTYFLPYLQQPLTYEACLLIPTISPFIIYKYSLFLSIPKWLLLLLTSTWLKPPDPILQASSLQFLSLKAHDYRLLPGISDCLSSATLKPQTHADGP